jgi:hypothetical protein
MEELEREEFSRIFPKTGIFRDFLREEQRSTMSVGGRAALRFACLWAQKDGVFIN